MTIYRILADLVVVFHFAYVACVVLALPLIVLGGVLHWRWVRNFWFRIIHFAMIAVVVFEAVWGIECPLTTWENALRAKAGEATYAGSFIGNWAHGMLFYEAPEWVFTLCYVIFGGLVLATLLFVPPRRPRKFPAASEQKPGSTAD